THTLHGLMVTFRLVRASCHPHRLELRTPPINSRIGVSRQGTRSRPRRRMRTGIAVVTVVLALTGLLSLLLAGPAGAISASQVPAQLNGERAQNGIPAGITEDKKASSGCAAHNRYEHLNHAL